MSRLECLLLVLAICEGVLAKDDYGFVEPLDFSQFFDSGSSGVSSLASGRIAAAMLNVDKSQYPQLFDTFVSSSIDSLQTQVAPKDNPFSPEHYGFNPIASSGFYPPGKAARIVAQPHHSTHQLSHRPKKHPTHLPLQQQPQQHSPLLYDIQQIHDADYKVYKPEDEEQEQGQGEILAALRKDPNVSGYFKPAQTNIKVSHPLKYRKEEFVDSDDSERNYRPDAYITGSSRIRRYAGSKKSEKLKSSAEDEEDEPYDYKADYTSRPKAFDSDLYSSPYKEEKEEGDHDHDERDPNKDYEYEGYDSGYDDKEYERIKELSEKQAAEIKQNPGNCKEVLKDGMTCMTCKDPKTGGNYESCSYVAEPKNNKYAYSKENKFNTKDQPDEPEDEQKSGQREPVKDDSGEYPAPPPKHENTHDDYKREDEDEESTTPKYNAYYVQSSKPLYGAAIREAKEAESSEEKEDTLTKPYNYKQAIPELYTDNEPKKDVEHVLAEFKKKDRSTCKKVYKGGMTCYQCIDKSGVKNEECMFVSESAPKRSHLAYQEVKEFTSKPPVLHVGNEGSESILVTTSAPFLQKSAAYVVAPNQYGQKLKRKKTRPVLASTLGPAFALPAPSPITRAVPIPRFSSNPPKVKRSLDIEKSSANLGESRLAPPEEFAGESSKGAFWAETMPRYSAALGVTLPHFMLTRSEHEAVFDEMVAGG